MPSLVTNCIGDVPNERSLAFTPELTAKPLGSRRDVLFVHFQVLANDTGGLQDEAHVFIYLLREDQRVRFVLRSHPSEIRDKIHVFRERLARVTDSVVNVDDLRVHENKDGSVDNTKTDLYLHLVNGEDHSVLEVEQVLKLVDKNIEQLDDLFKVILRHFYSILNEV